MEVDLDSIINKVDKNNPVFDTDYGRIYNMDSHELMMDYIEPESIDLIVTSPPFGLLRSKEYGNEYGNEYIEWFKKFAKAFKRILKDSGSLVIDLGGAWTKGQPTRSLYQFKLLIMLCEEFGFHLAQEFYWWNPSKLPTPAEWVTIRRIRVKDAINTIWWLSKTPYPKSTNKRVLIPYSDSHKDLLENGYTPKLRPSGHDISDKFQNKNAGAIPPNLISLPNTESNSGYLSYCKDNDIKPHPARFPLELPAMFIRMLTDKGDVVLDPFAGSCVTGEASQILERKWICSELVNDYIHGAKGRFDEDYKRELKERDKKKHRLSYNAPAPCLNLMSEENSPLPKDGGRTRQNKKNK
jgi:site-specific DNA-methyltransferase (cytosine-N4-specific)